MYEWENSDPENQDDEVENEGTLTQDQVKMKNVL